MDVLLPAQSVEALLYTPLPGGVNIIKALDLHATFAVYWPQIGKL